jgi:rod shape-determining protein MreB
VSSASLRVAGDEIDERIIEFVKLRYSLLIGVPTAERTKIALADARPSKEIFQVVRGRDLESGLPRSIKVSNFEIFEALSPSFEIILEATVHLFEEAPPELVSDVMQSGIMLCGGGALIRNFDVVLAERLHVKVTIAEDPLTAVVRGCAKLLVDRDLLKKVSYSDRKR